VKLLIVDDYPGNLKLLRMALEAEGHEVVERVNGVEALEALKREPVDAVISDILMPVMDGFRLCQEIRRDVGSPIASLPVVLYTATYDSPTDRKLADAVGADAYVLKPAPVEVLLEAVRVAQQKGCSTPDPAVAVDELEVLEQYNAALVRKLERRNAELQEALSGLQAAHEHILELNQNL
jgi:CheY-like chemotaxis protein